MADEDPNCTNAARRGVLVGGAGAACRRRPARIVGPRMDSNREAAMRKRIVIADRDDDSLSCLTNLLDELGYDVLAVHDAAEALNLAQRNWPRAIGPDIGTPQLEGLAGAARLRELAANRPLLLI